jgi:hypothetical protein
VESADAGLFPGSRVIDGWVIPPGLAPSVVGYVKERYAPDPCPHSIARPGNWHGFLQHGSLPIFLTTMSRLQRSKHWNFRSPTGQ